MTFHGLVPVALNSNKLKDGLNIHPSFSTILKDKTRGGILLSNVILNLHKENKLGLPLYLTPMGIKASHDLIDMLNFLPTNNNSRFKGDNLLLDSLSSKTNLVIRYNMENTLKTIIPIVEYKLPIGYQKVLDGDCSGLYCFIHKTTGKDGIGSALSCRNRLNDHINSLNGHRLRYLNVEKPKGTQTEMGCFYFARHPDYLPNLAKTATGLFAVKKMNTSFTISNGKPLLWLMLSN
jgi:hypothetical protein